MAKSRVIGLDIGTSAVRAVEIEFRGSGPADRRHPGVFQKYESVPLPPGAVVGGEVAQPATVTAAIRQLWKQAKFTVREVVIGVASDRVVVRDIQLPWIPENQLRASLPFQVADQLPMSVDDAVLDFYPTSQSETPEGPKVNGLLVAATRQSVEAQVKVVEDAGLSVTMVDLDAFAQLRALTLGELSAHTVALVNVGARMTHVVISAAGQPQFVRIVASGGADLTDAVGAALSVDTDEAERIKRQVGLSAPEDPQLQPAAAAIRQVTDALIASLRSTLIYYSTTLGGPPVESIVLTGGGVLTRGLGGEIARGLNLDVSYGDSLADFSMPRRGPSAEETRKMLPYCATAVGLACGVAA